MDLLERCAFCFLPLWDFFIVGHKIRTETKNIDNVRGWKVEGLSQFGQTWGLGQGEQPAKQQWILGRGQEEETRHIVGDCSKLLIGLKFTYRLGVKRAII